MTRLHDFLTLCQNNAIILYGANVKIINICDPFGHKKHAAALLGETVMQPGAEATTEEEALYNLLQMLQHNIRDKRFAIADTATPV